MKGFAGAVAALILLVGLAVSRFLARVVNVQIWLRLLARTPPDTATVEIADQIFVPPNVRQGLWPGLLLFLPLFWVGLAMVKAPGILFGIGLVIAVVTAPLAVGAIWSVTGGGTYPNRSLAEARIERLSAAIDDDPREPLASYRRFWRAAYRVELAAVGEADLHASSAATRLRTEALLQGADADIAAARRQLPDGDRLRPAIDRLAAAVQKTLAVVQAKRQALATDQAQLAATWPAGSPSATGSLRIVQPKEGSALLYELTLDDIDLLATLQGRKRESPLIVTSLADAARAVDGRKSGVPWGELDIVCPLGAGTHRLTVGKDKASASVTQFEVEPGGRYLASISFDAYAGAFVVATSGGPAASA
jgi:hypothetical protein